MSFKNYVLVFTVLLAACAGNTSITENISSSESNHSSVATEDGWKMYHDDRFGFTIKYPEFVSDYSGEKWKMTIKQNQNGIEYGYDNGKYPLFRPIIIGNAESDKEILDFIHSFRRFGTGCTFEKIASKNGVSSIRVISNGTDLGDPNLTCLTNFAYTILHQESSNKIALMFYDQEGLFNIPSEDDTSKNSDGYYDTLIGGSFTFDKQAER